MKITQWFNNFKLRDEVIERLHLSRPKKRPSPCGPRYIPPPTFLISNPLQQTHPPFLILFIALFPSPIFCKSGPRKLPTTGTFETTSDTIPDPACNCSSITLLCLACSALDLAADTALAIPPATPPAAARPLVIN